MKCEQVKINLPEYIDGKLDGKTSGAVASHLETCENCRELYIDLKSFLEFTGSLPEIEPPAGMKEEFMEQVEAEFGGSGKKVVYFPAWIKIAAMVILVFGTFAAGYFSGPGKNETRELRA